MSENNGEGANEFVDQPEARDAKTGERVPEPVQTSAEETAPQPAAVAEAVKAAITQQGVNQIKLEPCPCGVANVNLIIDIAQGGKVGRGTCGACGIWGVDFLAPRSQDQELIGKACAKAWNEAPR